MDAFHASPNGLPLDPTARPAASATAAVDTLPRPRRNHGGARLLGRHAALACGGAAYT